MRGVRVCVCVCACVCVRGWRLWWGRVASVEKKNALSSRGGPRETGEHATGGDGRGAAHDQQRRKHHELCGFIGGEGHAQVQEGRRQRAVARPRRGRRPGLRRGCGGSRGRRFGRGRAAGAGRSSIGRGRCCTAICRPSIGHGESGHAGQRGSCWRQNTPRPGREGGEGANASRARASASIAHSPTKALVLACTRALSFVCFLFDEAWRGRAPVPLLLPPQSDTRTLPLSPASLPCYYASRCLARGHPGRPLGRGIDAWQRWHCG